MRKSVAWAGAAVSVVASALVLPGLVGSPAPAQDKPPAVARWEYKVVQHASSIEGEEEACNRLGGEGWELAGIKHWQGSASALIFKRPRR